MPSDHRPYEPRRRSTFACTSMAGQHSSQRLEDAMIFTFLSLLAP